MVQAVSTQPRPRDWKNSISRCNIPPCPTYQLWPFSSAQENHPKMPVRNPQNEFLEFPGSALPLAFLYYFIGNPEFPGIFRHFPGEGFWGPQIVFSGENGVDMLGSGDTMLKKSSFQYGMKFSIENCFFILSHSQTLDAEKQGPGFNISSENNNFKLRMNISSTNGSFMRGGMVFPREAPNRSRKQPQPSRVFWKGPGCTKHYRWSNDST